MSTTEFDATVDYYKILGVKKVSTQEEIKSAHISLALKYHPDVNKDTSALSKSQWVDIQNAYSVLSKPEVRMMYDLSRQQKLTGINAGSGAAATASEYVYTGDNGAPFYDTQRLQFKETQRTASSNWRELKDKYKSEQWQKKDLAFKKAWRARPMNSSSVGFATMLAPVVFGGLGIASMYYVVSSVKPR